MKVEGSESGMLASGSIVRGWFNLVGLVRELEVVEVECGVGVGVGLWALPFWECTLVILVLILRT